MVICPVAIAVGCKKCPIVSVCPVKTSLGDFKPEPQRSAAKPDATKKK